VPNMRLQTLAYSHGELHSNRVNTEHDSLCFVQWCNGHIIQTQHVKKMETTASSGCGLIDSDGKYLQI